MARMMATSGRTLVAEADCLVPVPLHRGRLWRRRFNQAALLARRIGAEARASRVAHGVGARPGDALPGRPEPRGAGREPAAARSVWHRPRRIASAAGGSC